jgi:hypothetical protein
VAIGGADDGRLRWWLAGRLSWRLGARVGVNAGGGDDVAGGTVETGAVMTWQPTRQRQATSETSGVMWHVVRLRAYDEAGGSGRIWAVTYLGVPYSSPACFRVCRHHPARFRVRRRRRNALLALENP